MADTILSSQYRHQALSIIDLDRLEHESRRYLYLGILAGIALQALLILLFPGYGIVISEHRTAIPIPVDLIDLPPDIANPYADWRPTISSPQPLERNTSTSAPPPVTTTRPERFGDSPVIVNTREGSSVLTSMNSVISDSLGIITGKALVPEITLPIRNQLFVDTGDMKTRIVFDPDNPQAIQGYAHYGVLRSQNLLFSDSRILSIGHLAEEVTRLTNIDLLYDNQVKLMESVPSNIPRRYNPERPEYNMALGDYNVRDRMAADYAFTIIPVESVISLTQEEYGALIGNNRFILVDNAAAKYDDGRIDACIRTFGYTRKDIDDIMLEFRVLPQYHPVYHCFYDFDGPPSSTEAPDRDGMDKIYGIYAYKAHRTTPVITKRLIGIYTPQGYSRSWEDTNNIEQIKMGVNLVVYALAQYGLEYQPETDDYKLTSDRRVLER